ncbi:hypothetical protein [Nonomuraea sp. SYSU D8015]|uniref:hypothetical protein n=1 Tax=Nonomuraea sp. SYSU D8015 TaxID=2593644 RepID=UPI00166178D6|nr:hypothetical protein [Nonomuraea sp. SYSU D8015]
MSDLCNTPYVESGISYICRRTKGHTGDPNPRKREHHDPEHGGAYWMVHDDRPRGTWVGGSGRTSVYKGVCRCGWLGSNGTRSKAQRDCEGHQRNVRYFADTRGIILQQGDIVLARKTSFDGPAHLHGIPLKVVKFGRTKVYVSTSEHSDRMWPITAATVERTLEEMPG